jgi:large subunit ribosomal protein L15
MKYNELQTSGKKSLKRVGRGIAAGQGKTAGRGTKGQGARTGSKKKPGFEGGSNPLMQRLPKLPGFTSKRIPAEVVYTGDLDKLGVNVDATALFEAGLISSHYVTVKLLVRGEVAKKHSVQLSSASAAAIEAVQKAGGSFEKTPRVARQAVRPKEERKAKNS